MASKKKATEDKQAEIEARGKVTPLSQDDEKIKKASKEECIAELRRIAEIDVTKIISRNYFRNHSKYAESAWNAHFGTFHEFKSAANITLSRGQFRLEKAIAKHASVDKLRAMNEQKAGRDGKYLRPQSSRFQTVLACSDVHDRECDPFFRYCFLDTAKRVQPAKIIFDGDIFDLPEFGKYDVDPREWDVTGRIQWVHDFWEECREAAPNAEFVFVEGNHEFRLLRHLTEQSPAMIGVLSDLHGFTVPKLLGLDKYEINYVSRTDLATFTEAEAKKELSENFYIAYDAFMAIHYPYGRSYHMPGFNGHHHKHIVWTEFSPIYGAYEWHQLGTGHKRRASYTNGKVWTNGFILANVDTHTKYTQFEYVELRDHAVIGGKWYYREQVEKALVDTK